MTTTDRPVVLDLFGGRTGGAARGYQLAGFRVVSVDIVETPQNPADVCLTLDALEHLRHLIAIWSPALLHGAPPCQGNGGIAQGTMPSLRGKHPDLIPATREAFDETGLPYVIENPVHSRSLRKDIVLCGEMFDLGVLMHRGLELGGPWRSWPRQPEHRPHRGRVRGYRHKVWYDGPYVAAYGKGGGKATVAEMQRAKRISWSDDHLGLRDATPPAYTLWVGGRFRHIHDLGFHGPNPGRFDLTDDEGTARDHL